MARQLLLLDPPDQAWKFDEPTKLAGRRGLARARAALAALAALHDDSETTHPPAAA